nr:hypothetical protein [Tanacetum cinerariifolium]
MNMGQDRQMMNVRNQVAQNPRVQNVRNQNGLIGVQGNGNQNQIGNGNLVAVHTEGNAAGHNGNQIRPVTTAVPQPHMTRPRPAKTVVTKPYSPPRRDINHRPSPKPSNFPPKVTTTKAPKVNAVKGVQGNWGNPQHALNDNRVIDSRCSRHMTGNMFYLSDFEEINGGYVACGGNPNCGKITGKGKIRTAGSESRPPMLNKENYVLGSSRLLRYAKSRPNGKLIHNSIINGPYVRRMIPKPGDTNRKVPVNETFHTILLGLPGDIYAAVDSCENAQEIWLRVQQMMNGSDIGIQEKKAKLFNEWESNLKFLNNLQPEWSRHVTIVHQTKDLHTADYTQLYDFLKYNQKEDVGNLNGYNAVQNVGNQVAQNPRVQNVGNHNGLIGVPGNANLNGNGNLVATRTEGNAAGQNGNQIRCYNCRGVGIQLQAEEFDLMAATADLEIEKVNANYILMANLQQASTSGTHTDKAPVYDSDGSAEVHDYENCNDNEIFNMFTQEEQYTELLEPIPEPHQVPQNDTNVISEVTSVEQSGKTVEQHPANFEETHLNKQLSKEKSIISFLLEEKKRLKSAFKTREYELLDKQIQLETKIKELNNILVKMGKPIQTIHMLSPKPDSFYHTEQKMVLGYQNPFYLKQAQNKQQSLYDGKLLLEKHDPPVVHDSEETLQLAQESRQKMKQLNK